VYGSLSNLFKPLDLSNALIKRLCKVALVAETHHLEVLLMVYIDDQILPMEDTLGVGVLFIRLIDANAFQVLAF
jgi:hypothetical protein